MKSMVEKFQYLYCSTKFFLFKRKITHPNLFRTIYEIHVYFYLIPNMILMSGYCTQNINCKSIEKTHQNEMFHYISELNVRIN